MSELTQTNGGQRAAPPAPESKAFRLGRPSGRRKWAFRLAALILVPALIFGLLEIVLRVAGYGYPTDFFLDGSSTERPGVLIDNPDFGRWVFPRSLDSTPVPVPFIVSAVKPPGTYRVFVVGESAAMGFPDPSTSFPRVLEVMLRDRFPDKHVEVVNASVVAINSHVVLPVARQCLQHDADLLVVHLGNNEVVGPFGAAGVLGPFSPNLGLLRANLAVKTTRTGQLVDALVHGFRSDPQTPRTWKGMRMFVNSHIRADDGRLMGIYDHYRDNLQDICTAAAQARVPVIVCTIPVNLKDCAPFGSSHSAGLNPEQTTSWDETYQEGVRLEAEGKFADAIPRYEEAEKTDDQFADLAFRLGRCHAAVGDSAEARKDYVRARDLDTLPFRSNTKINDTIREVVAARSAQGAFLADAEHAFDEASPSGVPGEEFFLEHVHMNFHGNYTLARAVFQTLMDVQAKTSAPRAEGQEAILSEAVCSERLARTEWTELKIATQIYGMLTEQPPFTDQLDHVERGQRWKAKLDAMKGRLQQDGNTKAAAEFEAAVQANETDWMLRNNYGQFLSERDDAEGAEKQYRAVLVQCKHNGAAHCKLGLLLLETGRQDEAASHFRDAMRLVPNYAEAHYGLADALAAQGKVDEGLKIYEQGLDSEPNRAAALVELGNYLLRNVRPLEAKARYAEALQLDPSNTTAHVKLGELALRGGSVDEAIDQYDAALRIQPDLPGLSDYLAKLRKNRVLPVDQRK